MDSQIKVLLIDDDEVDRTLIKRALKGTGFNYTVVECAEAARAVTILKEHRFDCVFLDYLLPGTDGLMLLKELRAEGINTPIVIITSQGDEKIAVDMMKAGATDYVIKTHLDAHSVAQILRNAIRFQEIEKQKIQTELALKESEARLAEALSIAKLGNWECNCHDYAFYWSVEMYRIFDKDPKSYTPALENLFDNIHPDDRGAFKRAIQGALEGKKFNIDFRFSPEEEYQKYANTQGYTVFDEDNKPVKIIGTVQDITDRKQVEQELIKAKQLTEETSKAKEQFLANMSHEIRTPMNAIIGFARLLLKEELTAEQKKYIQAIYHSGENLLVIINDILDFSKISSGKLVLEEAPFLLPEVVSNIVEMFSLKAREKNIRLSSNIEKEVPVHLMGDSVRLAQVLTNLISNALKFTEQGHIHLNIALLEENDDFAELQYAIEDTGIGIPEDKLDSIFESFTQASSNTTRKFGGTGLGLTIVKNIVELQSGHIKVMSKEGKGSTFVIACKYKKPKIAMAGSEVNLPMNNAVENYSEALNGVKVLIAEDNHLNQVLAKAVLTKVNCTVEVAENGLVAIGKLKDNQYDIVLMDIQMPEMDGYEATKFIRTQLAQPLAAIPIIAMTAHALHTEIEKCLSMGMNDYISKPFKAADLYSKVYHYTARNKEAAVEGGRYASEMDAVMEKPVSIKNEPEHAETEKSHAPVVNFKNIREYAEGDNSFMTEIVNLFLLEMPKYIEELVKLHQEKDWNGLRLLAHKCKSSYGVMGVKPLQALMEEIEALCAGEKIDDNEIGEIIGRVLRLNSQMIAELETELERII